MRVAVEIARQRCQGHARCVALAPALFDLADDGIAVVRPTVAVLEEAMQAARNCPEHAVIVRRDGRVQDER